ncbi:hypothetical protein U9M48_026541, partial [Paspalum notatum var. saurae]
TCDTCLKKWLERAEEETPPNFRSPLLKEACPVHTEGSDLLPSNSHSRHLPLRHPPPFLSRDFFPYTELWFPSLCRHCGGRTKRIADELCRLFVWHFNPTSPIMAIAIKGIFKGLKIIAQIFTVHREEEGEEREIEIGYPTDVRHVSHIGLGASSDSCPSWMIEFRGVEEAAEGGGASIAMSSAAQSSLSPWASLGKL